MMLSNAKITVEDSNGVRILSVFVRDKADFTMVRMLISQYYLNQYEEAIAPIISDVNISEAERQTRMCSIFDVIAREMNSQFALLDDLEKGDEVHG